MCNGASARTSYGGTIAVLKPVTALGSSSTCASRPSFRRELSLQFADDACHGGTLATIDGLQARAGLGDAHFVIHRDGDLRQDPSAATVMHRFHIPNAMTSARVSFPLQARLDLGVGGDGVIGRRVSYMQGQNVIGEGIIGWN